MLRRRDGYAESSVAPKGPALRSPSAPARRGWTGRLALVAALTATFALGSSTAWAAAGPSGSHGVISGQLGYEGGAYPGLFHATAGIVKVKGPDGNGRVKVPASGFSMRVAPGHYVLTGCSGTRNKQCGPPDPVTVKAGKTSHVEVVWLLAP